MKGNNSGIKTSRHKVRKQTAMRSLHTQQVTMEGVTHSHMPYVPSAVQDIVDLSVVVTNLFSMK